MKFNIFQRKEKRNVDKSLGNEKITDDTGGIGLNFNKFFTLSNPMRLSAVYRAVNIIADSVAQLPIKTYIERGGYKEEYRNHPVYRLLYAFPNPNISRFILIRNMVRDMLLHGNAYAFIERERVSMKPVKIYYVPATKVSIQYDDNNIVDPDINYIVNGFKSYLKPADMLHILNYTKDGISGISTIQYASMSTDISMSSELHAQNFFDSGANLAGVLNVESALSKAQKAEIQDGWNKAFRQNSAGENTGIAVLQGNMKYQPLTVNPTDAQLLETRKFNITDIARFFGVSPTKLFDFTNSSYSTVEATQLAFLTDTLTPILENFELEFERKLFFPHEMDRIDVKFDTATLVRTDLKAQSEYYRTLYNMGAITPNEIRKEIMKNPIDGGDNVFVQGAMATMDNVVDNKNYEN